MSPCNPSYFLPSQYGADRASNSLRLNGFYDVVVRTEFETDDAIDFVGTMAGCDDHRNIRMRTISRKRSSPSS